MMEWIYSYSNVYNYLSGLKFIFNTVLESFSFNFHWCQHQTIANKMRCVSHSFGRFKAAHITQKKKKNHKYFQLKLMNFWGWGGCHNYDLYAGYSHKTQLTRAFTVNFACASGPLSTGIHLQKAKMCSLCICVSLACTKEALFCYILPIEVGFFAFNVDRIDWIQPEPRCECEPVLVRPFSYRWQHNSLYAWKQRKQNILFM